MKNKNKILLFGSVTVSVFLSFFFSHSISFAEQSLVVAQIQENSSKSVQSDKNAKEANAKIEENGLVPCSVSECTFCHLLKLAERIFFWLLAFSFNLAIFFVIVGGYVYISSGGNSDSMSWAKENLKNILIGISVCLVAWLLIHGIYTVLGYKGSWWRMECAEDALKSSDNKTVSNSEIYKNEVTANNQGGRNNPVTLPDLAATGIKNLPKNKYFFIHGLGGQPLENAAKQLAQITEEANKEGKIVYAITPVKNRDTLEIEGPQPVNLTKQIGTNLKQTQKNIKAVITGLIADSPTGTNFPFFIADSEENLTNFNNIWPNKVSPEQSLKTYHNGVVYEEGKTLKKGEEETLFSVNLVSDDSDDKKNEKFYLNRDNPITFKIPQDISPQAAKQMAVDIAQVVAESVKNSESLNKDQWNQIVGLMSKDIAAGKVPNKGNANSNDEENEVYSPAVFASYALKNPGQITDLEKLKKVEKELDSIAKDIIDKELPQNTNNNQNKTKASPINLNDTLSDNGGVLDSIQEYFFHQFSNTPALNNWIAGEKKIPENGNGSFSGINVNRVPSLDPTQLSKIGGRITTDNMLSLKEREAIRNLIVDIQKEMKDNTGIDYNIPPDLIMCVFEKESKFDPGAMSQTGCSGLGQMSMGATRSATKKLKKLAPKHFEALSEKIRINFGVDMEETLTREGGGEKKREILRSDPNLNAALSYTHLTEKGIVGRGGSARNIQDLKSMVIGYGPGNSYYAISIFKCLENGSWRVIPEKIQAIIDAREAKNKE